jgi:hypothetical protein
MSHPNHQSETIERELTALGEAPANAEELAAVGLEIDEQPELAVVARLTELAEPLGFDDLSELELHRAWRKVEQVVEAGPEPGDAQREPAGPAGAGPRRWLYAAFGLAAAAALLLLVVRPFGARSITELEPDAEAVLQLGDQVRATLRALEDGVDDTQRAELRLLEYQGRLEELGG